MSPIINIFMAFGGIWKHTFSFTHKKMWNVFSKTLSASIHSSPRLLVHLCARGKVCPAGGDLNLFCLCLHYCSPTLLLVSSCWRQAPSGCRPLSGFREFLVWRDPKEPTQPQQNPHRSLHHPHVSVATSLMTYKPKCTPLYAISSLTLRQVSKVGWALQVLQMD